MSTPLPNSSVFVPRLSASEPPYSTRLLPRRENSLSTLSTLCRVEDRKRRVAQRRASPNGEIYMRFKSWGLTRKRNCVGRRINATCGGNRWGLVPGIGMLLRDQDTNRDSRQEHPRVASHRDCMKSNILCQYSIFNDIQDCLPTGRLPLILYGVVSFLSPLIGQK